MIATFVILAVTIVLFVWGKIRSDLVALLSLLSLYAFGILSVGDALAGFSDSTVVMIAALFVVGEGLSRTGVTAWFSQRILRLAGSNVVRLLVVMMAGTALLSAFISNTGTVATLLPAVVSAAWSIGSVPSQFLMPLAFAANTGGLLTLTGTPPNIVVANVLTDAGLRPFGFFEYALIGLPLLLCAIGYMVFLGRRLLPERGADERPADLTAAMGEMAESFALEGKLYRVMLTPDSQLTGKTLADAALGRDFSVSVLQVLPAVADAAPSSRREARRQRRRQALEHIQQEMADMPGPETVIHAGDTLVVKGTFAHVARAVEMLGLRFEPIAADADDLQEVLVSREIGVAEVLVTPRSAYNGRTVSQSRLAEKFNVQVISIRRGDRLVSRRETQLAFGDALLVRGSWDAIEGLANERRNFVVVGRPDDLSRQVIRLGPHSYAAILVMIGMVGMMIAESIPTVVAALVAAAAMVLIGCVSGEEAYRSISWSSVILIAAMIPMSTALQITGGADLLANVLVDTLGQVGPLLLMAGVFLLTTAFSQVINNTATAVLVAPIVLQAALELGVNPHPLLMTVAVSASTAFLTPIGTTTNLMVLSPGSYRFTDYVKVGLPLMVLFLIVTLVLVPLIWPF